ncbi:HAD family hydrolase [Nonomuraea sp. NPDC050556]|uniref:HAD family hydrolase n=1 Tax=Nonomuraea sp. NPDC050556 TaxID=3364369 RepID=UPI0037927993
MEFLASWRDTPTRAAITSFVESLTLPGEERVAVFDNDGTLWCEKPIPIQLDFNLRRFAEQAEQDPGLRSRQPWKAAYTKDFAWLNEAVVKHYNGDDTDLGVLAKGVEQAFTGVTVQDYAKAVTRFFAEATHPTLRKPYSQCVYQPMIELLRYLEANGFATYIASAGDRDFMRPIAQTFYGIPPERVIGSSIALTYRDGEVVYKDRVEFFDDGPEKPPRIWSRLGRRPVISVGNSNGDVPMWEFGDGLGLLLHHDDAEREFAYDTGAEKALAQDWTVISIKDDWTTVFPGSV